MLYRSALERQRHADYSSSQHHQDPLDALSTELHEAIDARGPLLDDAARSGSSSSNVVGALRVGAAGMAFLDTLAQRLCSPQPGQSPSKQSYFSRPCGQRWEPQHGGLLHLYLLIECGSQRPAPQPTAPHLHHRLAFDVDTS